MADPQDKPQGSKIDLDKIQADVNEHFIQAAKLTPADTQALLDQAKKALKDAWNFTFEVSLHPSTWMPDWTTDTFALQQERLSDVGKLFHYYQGVLDEGVEEKIYREVTSPLILGKCYGEPSCTDAVVANNAAGTDKYGPFVLQAPTYTAPYILTRTMEVFLSGAQHEWDLFIDDVVERARAIPKFVIDTGTDYLKPLLLGVGLIVGLSLITRFAGTKKAVTGKA